MTPEDRSTGAYAVHCPVCGLPELTAKVPPPKCTPGVCARWKPVGTLTRLDPLHADCILCGEDGRTPADHALGDS
jgi:hypothetical protein